MFNSILISINSFRFETSSTTLIFCLHLLAHHQDIQDQARESIRQVLDKNDGEWSYDAVMELNYIEQILEETLVIIDYD